MKFSDSHKNNLSKARKGYKATEEAKTNMSKSMKGKNTGPQIKLTCHCGKVGGASVMKRWHFENCRVI